MRAIMRGLTEVEFERLYGTEAQCEAALVAVRLAAGMACPSCANTRSYVYGRRVGCTRCPRRWSITAGTVMANTKLGLATWFRAMHLMTSTKQAISAVELGRRLGLRYDTAWYLHKRLRHAMRQQTGTERLGGPGEGKGGTPIVEADDVYLGGERNEGRGTAGKTRVIAACERHAGGRMGRVALQVVARFSSAEAKAFGQARLAPSATVYTDGLKAFAALAEDGRTHVATPTGGTRPARARSAPFFVVNTLVANLSTALKATHKRFSPKHLPDYLGAFCWTTNRRRAMHAMVPALCAAAAAAAPITRKAAYA